MCPVEDTVRLFARQSLYTNGQAERVKNSIRLQRRDSFSRHILAHAERLNPSFLHGL